jgi:epoxyqueuosine reductase
MCIDNCPTGALQENGGFDAGRCINYLTIEHKGYIPKELASKTGKRIFGCNNCITVCPFYRKSPSCRNTDFNFDTQRRFINPAEILKMNEKQFREKFHNTCIYRTGLQMLKRNAAIALGLDIQDFPQ